MRWVRRWRPWRRWRRVEERTCTACGYRWSVPAGLRRRRRPSRWRSGIQPADLGPMGGVFPEHLRWALDQAAERRRAQEADMALRAQLATCAQCGSTSWSRS